MVDKITNPVSQLKVIEKINELIESGSSNSDIFWAEYGTTTYTNIVTAYNAGKLVCTVDNDDIVYVLSYVSSSEAIFSANSSEYIMIATVSSSNVWDTSSTEVQGKLVSGTNIKTINNTSLLGSGNISLSLVTFREWS